MSLFSKRLPVLLTLAVLMVCSPLTACGQSTPRPTLVGIGPHPALPPPQSSLVPTVNVAPLQAWPAGQGPQAAQGLQVNRFAVDLDHPRTVYVLPNGDVLVAESNAPAKETKTLKEWVTKRVKKTAGAVSISANRITLLRDSDGDGVADVRTAFIENLNSPFGIALVGHDLYVANTDAVLKFPYTKGESKIRTAGTEVLKLPAGPINQHWTRNLIASRDGRLLYVTVGSNSNIAENGMEAERGRAAIWELDLKSGKHRIFATGLRNPNGMAWEPVTQMLWTVVNERDGLGDDLVPDYLTRVDDGAFYGWPYSYFGAHVDERVKPQKPEDVARAIAPDYALGAHTAALGLASSEGTSLEGTKWPAPFTEGMFIGLHGSWNRRLLSGYKVIFVPFHSGRPSGLPLDVLSGFLSEDGKAHGRPVGVAVDKRGALLVADDGGNIIWRVSPQKKSSAAP